jgi:hypothetical protein
MIPKYQNAHERLNEVTGSFRDHPEEQERHMEAILAGIQTAEEIFGEPKADNTSEADDARTASLVRKASAKCFGGESDLSTLTILEKLENDLEKMNRFEVYVNSNLREQPGNQKIRRGICKVPHKATIAKTRTAEKRSAGN